MTGEEPESQVEPPTRRSILKKTVVLGAASASGTAFIGSAVAQPDEVSGEFSPPVELADTGAVQNDPSISGVDSMSYEVKDVGQESADLESLSLLVEEVEGREDSGRGRLSMAVEATNTDRDTETSDFRTVPFEATAESATQEEISPMQADTCEILFLNLEGLTIRLLGLRIRLEEVILLIEAEQGQGNLLGNLLCAIARLLDPP